MMIIRFIDEIFVGLLRVALAFRYRIKMSGLEAVEARGTRKVLFLPNHPAYIDPVIMYCLLHKKFRPRALADEHQINRPVIGPIARHFGVRTLPNLERRGAGAAEGMKKALHGIIDELNAGNNVLLYPAGMIKRSRYEDLGAASAVEAIIRAVPDVRIVLIRQNGLWGSSFSFAIGRQPHFAGALIAGVKKLLLNGIFFMPKRCLDYVVEEPADFPRQAERRAMNAYIETFYNKDARPNTYVPYFWWEKGGAREAPEPKRAGIEGDTAAIPQATKELVINKLKEMTGRVSINENDSVSRDLGLDSLAAVELMLWIEKEFGFDAGTPDALRTVKDVILCAAGKGVSTAEIDVPAPKKEWFDAEKNKAPAKIPHGATITEVFLNAARERPSAAAIADLMAGVKTYRGIITGIMALVPRIRRIEGDYVGIMFPSSAASVVFYFAALFSGKIPVMVNWTTGERNIAHALKLLGVKGVITSKTLVDRVETQGVSLKAVREKFMFAEEIAKSMTTLQKLKAATAARVSWRSLRAARVQKTAVVLFTSGSESLPKAVPLTHENILANIRDTLSMVALNTGDSLMAFLPPFHSFGLTVCTVFPLCSGVRAVYYPNPTEGANIAKVIAAYKTTMALGTPTFLGGIARAGSTQQLSSVRLAVTGAEKCPESVYALLRSKCPGAAVLEGYGITECSPIVSVNPEKRPREGTIGRPMPSVECAIVDSETMARRVLPGETGMLLVKGPGIFGGYLNYDGDSPFVEFEGGRWYKTGDLVKESADGYLTFMGRLKRFIKLGGEMVSLPAIEEALLPRLVSETDKGPSFAVEATPSADAPEIVLFTVEPVERAKANDIIRAAGLSALHNIRRVVRLDAIPVLGTGKTDYRALKELLKNG